MTDPSSSAGRVSPHRQTQPARLPDGGNATVSDPSKPWTKKNPLIYNMQSIIQRGKALLTPSGSNQSLHKDGFTTVKDATALFPGVDPAIDGEECLHDCASCTVTLPRKWSIDEEDTLFGHVNGWESHVIVATSKTDWVRDITDEKGSLMEKIGQVCNKGKQMEYNRRKIMLSASDLPTGNDDDEHSVDLKTGYAKGGKSRCLVLPSWKFVEGVTTDQVEWMLGEVVSRGSSNTQIIKAPHGAKTVTSKLETNGDEAVDMSRLTIHSSSETPRPALTIHPPEGINVRACPHQAVILMCSHKTRDWRCGASAPLLRKEFERHLRPLGLYRDIHDERPGGVGIYFINHVGGHKYSANVMIYRRQGSKKAGEHADSTTLSDEAVQGIWLARVRPEDCENIVKYTVLEGRLVKPQRQLRGGFDRESGLMSW